MGRHIKSLTPNPSPKERRIENDRYYNIINFCGVLEDADV